MLQTLVPDAGDIHAPSYGNAVRVRKGKKKGPARGESEAFGSLAEAADRASAAGEEVGRNLLALLMAAAATRDKRKASSAAMQKVASERGQKKGSITKMEPLESGGKRTREEETPFAYGPCRGRRKRRRPGAD